MPNKDQEITNILTSYNADDITFSELVDSLWMSGRQSMLPNKPQNVGINDYFKITANTYENTSASVEFDINTLFNNGFENSMCDPITNLLGVSVDNIVLEYESPIHLKMKKCRKHIELFNADNSFYRKVVDVRIAIQEILLELCHFYRLYPSDMEGKDYTGQTFTFHRFGDIRKNVLFEDFDEDFHFCYEIIK